MRQSSTRLPIQTSLAITSKSHVNDNIAKSIPKELSDGGVSGNIDARVGLSQVGTSDGPTKTPDGIKQTILKLAHGDNITLDATLVTLLLASRSVLGGIVLWKSARYACRDV